MLQQHEKFPLTIALFYDSRDLPDDLVKYAAARFLDIFVLKKEKILTKI